MRPAGGRFIWRRHCSRNASSACWSVCFTAVRLIRFAAASTPLPSENGDSAGDVSMEQTYGNLADTAVRAPVRTSRRGVFCRRQVAAPLGHGLEKFVAFPQTADADVLVLQHGFDDAQNRLRAQVVTMVETLHAFKDFLLAQAGKLERALLETVAFDEVGLVLLH